MRERDEERARVRESKEPVCSKKNDSLDWLTADSTIKLRVNTASVAIAEVLTMLARMTTSAVGNASARLSHNASVWFVRD